MSKPLETVLGIAGGFVGILMGLAVAFFGGRGEAFVEIPGAADLLSRTVLTLGVSALGLVAALLARRKLSVILMMVALFVGLVSAGVFYVVPAISLGAAALIASVKGFEAPKETSLRKCPHCGASVHAYARFCVNCDLPL